uniref:FAM20 C-terminal domain-containing protein n=1 Tax=Panagrolaimus sp. ES5 TaxID=591445 RepID=A0AC34FRZ0_9BILA
MNTLRFYTKRIFLVVCAVFFGFLILIASRSSSLENESHRELSQHYPRPLPRIVRPGEQLSFQPQPPPILNSPKINYHELGIKRELDQELLDRVKWHIRDTNLDEGAKNECKLNQTLSQYWLKTEGRSVPVRDSWEKFYAEIGTCDLYRDDEIINNLLKELSTMPIRNVHIMEGGTQVKLVLTFENEKQAVFKPMRFGRDYETDPNHFYFGDFERHNAEIATFHLDKILGFRRAVPTVGRVVNITSELKDKAERKLKKTFFVSPAKNHCFVGKCDYYCDTTHSICGAPDLKEGSVQVFLPDDTTVPRKHNKSPYRRTYSKKTQLAVWQQDMKFCHWKVKNQKQYAHGRRLLDLIDLHVMDYLIGNQDRHHYESFAVFDKVPSYAIHLDNGRSFGRTDFDDDDILLPLRQCCVIRPSTLNTLIKFYGGPKSLTQALHESLSNDPVSPVLAFKHYPALERRLHNIMKYILECLDTQRDGPSKMIITEYHNKRIPETPENENDDDEDDKKQDDTLALAQQGQQPPEPPQVPEPNVQQRV